MTVFYNFDAWDWCPVQLLIAFYKNSRGVGTEEAFQMANQ